MSNHCVVILEGLKVLWVWVRERERIMRYRAKIREILTFEVFHSIADSTTSFDLKKMTYGELFAFQMCKCVHNWSSGCMLVIDGKDQGKT